jgi:hypothetical protein
MFHLHLVIKSGCFSAGFLRQGKSVLQQNYTFLQGCQMVYFQTKNPNLGQFWRALPRLENVEIFMAIWNISLSFGYMLWPFGTFCVHLVLLVTRSKKNLATLLSSLSPFDIVGG